MMSNYRISLHSAAVVLLIILHMGCVMVILLNILIAQLSNTYTSAEENAMLQYDIDKTIFLAKLENSRFRKWVSSVGHV